MNYCSNCGAQMEDGTAFCPSCGAAQNQSANAPQPGYPEPVYQYQEPACDQTVNAQSAELTGKAKTFGLVSFICGIASIVLCCSGPVPGIAAIIFGKLAQNDTPAGVENQKAKLGLTLGIVGTALAVIAWIISFLAGFIGGLAGY